jgi:hypothetical protein
MHGFGPLSYWNCNRPSSLSFFAHRKDTSHQPELWVSGQYEGYGLQLEGYGLQPVHKTNKTNAGFSP